jgi:hypothetical protein
MRHPLVSILVRSVDRPTLSRALASIAEQDYPNVEAVVVAASAAHRELPDRCGPFPLRLVRASHPLARAEAANAALDAALGAWLNFLDDDDELLPSHVARLRAALDGEPGFRLAHSASEDRSADGRVLGRYGGRFKPWRQLDTGFFRPHCAMFARSLVDEGARFDPAFEILEDMDFFIQCAALTPFLFVEEATTRYYVDAGDSGAGYGTNRDGGRLRNAFTVLRGKWAGLEKRLHATPEFRAEHALFLIDSGYPDDAAPLVAGLLREDPQSVDGRILQMLQLIARGDVERARSALDAIGDAPPRVEDLAQRLDRVRAHTATPH